SVAHPVPSAPPSPLCSRPLSVPHPLRPPPTALVSLCRMKPVHILPALNEAAMVGDLIRRTPRNLIAEVIVVDNGSTDATAVVAREAGARVVSEETRGYGAACFAGVTALPPDTDVAGFLDADGSQRPEQIPPLPNPLP